MPAVPYLLWSDSHFHNWTAFSSVDENGLNTRLKIQLNEARKAYEALGRAGGTTAFHAGDLFHVRGNIRPSVLNPVRDFFQEMNDAGYETCILSGNHDLESNDASDLTSAVSAIASVDGVEAVNKVTMLEDVIMVPWYSKIADLENMLEKLSETLDASQYDLIIHAPVNDVLLNIPNTGMNVLYLKTLGYKRVFAGHYHNHKNFDDKVWSVGALLHQTWGDIDSQAGFCLVYPDRVEFIESTAPKFMRLPPSPSLDELEEVDGNYVRAEVEDPTPSRVKDIKAMLVDAGAAGVTIKPLVKTSTKREGKETVTAMDSLSESIFKYSKEKHSEKVAKAALEIFNDVEADI